VFEGFVNTPMKTVYFSGILKHLGAKAFPVIHVN